MPTQMKLPFRIPRLSIRDRNILTRVHRDKWTYKKTAAEVGLSVARVYQIVQKEKRRNRFMTRLFIRKMEEIGLEPSHLCYLPENPDDYRQTREDL